MRAGTSAATCSSFLRSGRAARIPKMPQKRSISAHSGHLDAREFGIKDCVLIDDVLFGEDWNNTDIDVKTRCIVTVTALISSGITDSSLAYHLRNAKAHGVTRKEIAAIITHIAFYAGWPKAWAAFTIAKTVWEEEAEEDKDAFQNEIFFSIGEPNALSAYFSGRSWLSTICEKPFAIYNVTFEPGCRNNWHIHHADEGGGQILICVGGSGWYQEWGKDAVQLKPGTAITIAPGVKHWHGAAKDAWMAHLAIEVPGRNTSNEWCEPVSDEQYSHLK